MLPNNCTYKLFNSTYVLNVYTFLLNTYLPTYLLGTYIPISYPIGYLIINNYLEAIWIGT
jgi:hypothetical protein